MKKALSPVAIIIIMFAMTATALAATASGGAKEITTTGTGTKITATGLQDKYYLFDLAAAGFGTGRVYALYFDDRATVTFNAPVMLTAFDTDMNMSVRNAAAGEYVDV